LNKKGCHTSSTHRTLGEILSYYYRKKVDELMICINETKDMKLISVLNYDVQEIHAEIEPLIFKHHNQADMEKLFEEALLEEGVHVFIATYNSNPAGYVMLSVRNVSETYFRYEHSVVYIEHICVTKEYKGNGIGRELINKVKEYALEHGISRIELDYWSRNENAGEFFKTQGFTNFNERMFIQV
jgi:ribosomal protein S18 acetylase RimI-like enzyme